MLLLVLDKELYKITEKEIKNFLEILKLINDIHISEEFH